MILERLSTGGHFYDVTGFPNGSILELPPDWLAHRVRILTIRTREIATVHSGIETVMQRSSFGADLVLVEAAVYEELAELLDRPHPVSTAANAASTAGAVAPNPYGVCPTCRGGIVSRERRPNGNDTCISGHVFPSAQAIVEPTSVPT